jgi:hypothetical protein
LKKIRIFDGVQRPRVRHLYRAPADSDGKPRSLSPSRCQTNAIVCVSIFSICSQGLTRSMQILLNCTFSRHVCMDSLFFFSSCSQGFSTSHTKSHAKPSHIYTRKTMFPPFQNRSNKTRKRNTLLKNQYYYYTSGLD